MKSANDISVALGEAVGGSESAFIARMNAEARRLGMYGTQFSNPHGLPSSRQYTTARDMAVLAIALHKEFPEHAWRFRVPAISSGKKILRSYNVLIGRFKGADGMKTGFVCAAGFNLVGSATRGRKRVISVVLGAKSQNERAEVSANLLEDAFRKRSGGRGKLKSLAPYGGDRNVKANMRPQICSSKAQRARWEVRDKKGRLKISSPHIRARTGKLQIIPVSLGGATGPTPRGQLVAQTTTAATGAFAVASLNVVPRFRPNSVLGANTASNAVTALRPSADPLAQNSASVAQLGGSQATVSTNGSLVAQTPQTPIVSAEPNGVVFAPIPRFRPR